MIKSSALLVGLISTLTEALNAPLPRATNNIANGLGYGTSPVPTTAPAIPREFVRRGTQGTLLGYYGPDNTCGYISGVAASLKTCDLTEICAAVVVSGIASMGCCDIDIGSCEFYGNCVNSVGYWSSNLCDDNCLIDPNTVKCTEATAPYCYSFLVPGMSMGFYSCAPTYLNTFASFLTTYNGEKDGRSWLPLYDSASAGGVFSTPVFLESTTYGTGDGFGTALTGSAGSASTVTAGGSSASGVGVPTTKKKSAPVGAIAGGVIGGLAVIALAAVGTIVLCARQRRNKNNLPPNNQGMQSGTASAPNPQFAAGSNHPMQQQHGQQMLQQPYYPQQNGYPPAQDPRYSYYSTAKDPLKGPIDTVSSIPPSPAPQYSATAPQMPTSPPQALMPGPPPGVVEAGGMPVMPSPQPSVVSPVSGLSSSPAMSHDHPQVSPPQHPVELGTTYAIPTKNAEGQPVFEAQ